MVLIGDEECRSGTQEIMKEKDNKGIFHFHGEKLFGFLSEKKINWNSLRRNCITWMKDPMNTGFILWFSCVTVTGTVMFFLLTGMLNLVLKEKSQRQAWIEVNNQIMNALCTLLCLFLHPKHFYHLVLICRWREEDMSIIRTVFCKNGKPKCHERKHALIIVLLLHLNCLGQYSICGLNWAYDRFERPNHIVGICIAGAVTPAILAGIYYRLSPLGKVDNGDIESPHEEDSNRIEKYPNEKKFFLLPRNDSTNLEKKPEWKGRLLDVADDISVSGLSLFFTLCVFGWNMQRFGFGNMYVHSVTFLLMITAPFFVFNMAAIHMEDKVIKDVFGIVGIVVSVFGLLYGGVWRIQMRKRFDFPENLYCFNSPIAADCAQWLFCSVCSLAQEVRTGNFYKIVVVEEEDNQRIREKEMKGENFLSLSTTEMLMSPEGAMMMAPVPDFMVNVVGR